MLLVIEVAAGVLLALGLWQLPTIYRRRKMRNIYLAGCGKSRKVCNEAAQNASNVHERNRSATGSRVQLHFPGATSAQGPSAAADPHHGGRNPEAAVAAVQQDVRESGPAIDSAGAVVAGAVVADVVFGAQRAAADGRDGLQHFVSLVCGTEFG